MGTFVTGPDALPAAKVDAYPPQNPTQEIDASDVNAIWGAANDLRDHTAGWVNLKSYGATGNGGTNDRQALVSANASALMKRVPAGTYLVSTSITLTGTWQFDSGATLRPASGATITFDTNALIRSSGTWIDTSLGGKVNHQAGASQVTVQTGTTSKTDSFINGFAGNAIAPDVSISVITGGGNIGSEQLIGYTENLDRITGNGATTVFTTSYDEVPANILLTLIRADKVRVTLASNQFGAVVSGTKVQVTYPLPGHFVNDATGGAEGTNAALLATQQLYIASNQKLPATGSGCDYSAIYGGYDNVISAGIRQAVEGAHHRMVGTGNHNTMFGGSYNRNSGSGIYGGIFGGSSNEDAAGGAGTFIAGFGNTVSGTGPGTAIGSTNTVSGAFAAALGGTALTASGNGAVATGRTNTVSGNDSFVTGSSNSVTSVNSFAAGLSNSVTPVNGYSAAVGRSNTVTGAFALASGRDNTLSADHSRVAGKSANAALAFADVIGGEQIAALGDVQTSTVCARRQTTTATATELRLGVAAARLTIPSNTTWMFNIIISARQTATATASAGWSAQGVLRNDAGTVALVAAVTPTVVARDASAAAWTVTVTADNTNKALSITATGEAAKTINWVARIELSEVAG